MKKRVLALLGALVLVAGAFAQDTMMKSGYINYSQKAFADSIKMKRVLFFAATWCPTCRAADKDINANLKRIPKDLVIFKTDYDTETALKTKYGITVQHTFVYVDARGDALKKWNGGSLEAVLEATAK